MSELSAGTSPPEPRYAGKAPVAASVRRSLVLATVAAVVMVLLALVGVGLTTASRPAAETYWISLVPVYGVLCIGTAWRRAWHVHGFDKGMVLRQVFHWLGVAGGLGLDFTLRRAGTQSGEAAGLNALLLLSLGCFLAGVHLDGLFAAVGVLLAATLVVVARAEQYLWLMFLAGAAVIVLMVAGRWLLARWRARRERGHAAAARP